MPEALSTQLNERNSSCTPDMESPKDLDAVSYENLSRTDRTMSVESLNTLLSQLPEISIPATLFNPLPLQCIAANALPKNVRAEIDGVIAQYTVEGNDGDIEDVDNLTPVLHRALGIEVRTLNFNHLNDLCLTEGCNFSKCQQASGSCLQENYMERSRRRNIYWYEKFTCQLYRSTLHDIVYNLDMIVYLTNFPVLNTNIT